MWVRAAALLAWACSGRAATDLHPPDLAPPAAVHKVAGKPITLIRSSEVALPIVTAKAAAPGVRAGAEFLASCLGDMTGVRPKVQADDGRFTNGAVFVGWTPAAAAAGIDAQALSNGAFVVKTTAKDIFLVGDDAVRFGSHAQGSKYAAADFAERVLGVRQYFKPEDGGRVVRPAADLRIPPIHYEDGPVSTFRNFYPYTQRPELITWRMGSTHPYRLQAHIPRTWAGDAAVPDACFPLNADGKRVRGVMLCFGAPETLQMYLARIREEVEGGRPSGVMQGASVAVSPADAGVRCHCKWCEPYFTAADGSTHGDASRLMCDFVRKLSDALAERHPDLYISYLPYMNYCGAPEGVDFPAGNVHAQLCIMSGVAMFRDRATKASWESLLRRWREVTHTKVTTWDYPCWPAEWCKAPYLYGNLIAGHYRDMRDVSSGSFLCGGELQRHALSCYLLAKALWNPEIVPDKVYDAFAKGLFGHAARPMRRIIAMQEAGWMRPWEKNEASLKNVYRVSYPRKDVLKMEALFAQAEKKAKGDALILKRIAWYKAGFNDFFRESQEVAEGSSFAPLTVKKVAVAPLVDGSLDDEAWRHAPALPFVLDQNLNNPAPHYPTTIQAVWTPDGICFGFRMTEPAVDKLVVDRTPGNYWNDSVEVFLDPAGEMADFYQIIADARDEGVSTHGSPWKPEGLRGKAFRGADFWSVEVWVPFTDIAKIPGARHPKGGAEGISWRGNFTRHRLADCWAAGRPADSVRENQRLNTRGAQQNMDPSAMGPIVFVE